MRECDWIIDFCIIHGYDRMKHQFGNPIPYCEACDKEQYAEEPRESNPPSFDGTTYGDAFQPEGAAIKSAPD